VPTITRNSTERLPGATAMYLLQNGCILVSAAAAWVVLWLAGGADKPVEAVGPWVSACHGSFMKQQMSDPTPLQTSI